MPNQNHNIRFVAPDPPTPRVEIIASDLPPAPISLPMPHSSHRDRAHGFLLVTLPLAGAAGVVAVLVAISAFGVPLLSVAALLCVLAAFTLTWLIAYIAHTMISPDGALFAYVVLTFAYLRREQAERIKRYGK